MVGGNIIGEFSIGLDDDDRCVDTNFRGKYVVWKKPTLGAISLEARSFVRSFASWSCNLAWISSLESFSWRTNRAVVEYPPFSDTDRLLSRGDRKASVVVVSD